MLDETTDEFLTEKQVAAILHFNVQVMGRLRRSETGPPYYKINGKVLYSKRELRNYILSCRVYHDETHQKFNPIGDAKSEALHILPGDSLQDQP
jgi:hypothetical protein